MNGLACVIYENTQARQNSVQMTKPQSIFKKQVLMTCFLVFMHPAQVSHIQLEL